MESHIKASQKNKIEPPYNPVLPTLGIRLKECKSV
jgi:hypothetical protein